MIRFFLAGLLWSAFCVGLGGAIEERVSRGELERCFTSSDKVMVAATETANIILEIQKWQEGLEEYRLALNAATTEVVGQ